MKKPAKGPSISDSRVKNSWFFRNLSFRNSQSSTSPKEPTLNYHLPSSFHDVDRSHSAWQQEFNDTSGINVESSPYATGGRRLIELNQREDESELKKLNEFTEQLNWFPWSLSSYQHMTNLIFILLRGLLHSLRSEQLAVIKSAMTGSPLPSNSDASPQFAQPDPVQPLSEESKRRESHIRWRTSPQAVTQSTLRYPEFWDAYASACFYLSGFEKLKNSPTLEKSLSSAEPICLAAACVLLAIKTKEEEWLWVRTAYSGMMKRLWQVSNKELDSTWEALRNLWESHAVPSTNCSSCSFPKNNSKYVTKESPNTSSDSDPSCYFSHLKVSSYSQISAFGLDCVPLPKKSSSNLCMNCLLNDMYRKSFEAPLPTGPDPNIETGHDSPVVSVYQELNLNPNMKMPISMHQEHPYFPLRDSLQWFTKKVKSLEKLLIHGRKFDFSPPKICNLVLRQAVRCNTRLLYALRNDGKKDFQSFRESDDFANDSRRLSSASTTGSSADFEMRSVSTSNGPVACTCGRALHKPAWSHKKIETKKVKKDCWSTNYFSTILNLNSIHSKTSSLADRRMVERQILHKAAEMSNAFQKNEKDVTDEDRSIFTLLISDVTSRCCGKTPEERLAELSTKKNPNYESIDSFPPLPFDDRAVAYGQALALHSLTSVAESTDRRSQSPFQGVLPFVVETGNHKLDIFKALSLALGCSEAWAKFQQNNDAEYITHLIADTERQQSKVYKSLDCNNETFSDELLRKPWNAGPTQYTQSYRKKMEAFCTKSLEWISTSAVRRSLQQGLYIRHANRDWWRQACRLESPNFRDPKNQATNQIFDANPTVDLTRETLTQNYKAVRSWLKRRHLLLRSPKCASSPLSRTSRAQSQGHFVPKRRDSVQTVPFIRISSSTSHGRRTLLRRNGLALPKGADEGINSVQRSTAACGTTACHAHQCPCECKESLQETFGDSFLAEEEINDVAMTDYGLANDTVCIDIPPATEWTFLSLWQRILCSHVNRTI
eukprot:GHVP01057782.1.p1 GENE.GHVP01057782.1~~GHVP01057782.1.p1  ORF type:complete len:1000 (+),score=163.00 GHVP01057782.1:4937-7936(+)